MAPQLFSSEQQPWHPDYSQLMCFNHPPNSMTQWTIAAFVCAIAAWASDATTAQPDRGATRVEQARQQLDQVLDQPAFNQWQRRQARAEGGENDGLLPEVWQQWIIDTREAIFNWIESWFRARRASNPGQAGNFSWSLGSIFEAIGWIVIAALVVFVLIIVVKLMMDARPRKPSQPVSRKRLQEAMDTGEALAAESPQWLAEAQQLAQEQDMRRAYRALYLALLSGLHQAEQINFRRNRTNWTYVRQYRGQAEQRQRLAQLTEQFDEIWYGRRSPHASSMQQARQQVETLLDRT